jgi:hypothetical protein
MRHVKAARAIALLSVLVPAMAEAHGIGLGEVSFGVEIVAFLVGLVVFSVGESVGRSVWLNLVYVCLVAFGFVVSFGVAGSLGAAALPVDETVPATLGAGLLLGAVVTWRLKRSQWRRKGGEHAA